MTAVDFQSVAPAKSEGSTHIESSEPTESIRSDNKSPKPKQGQVLGKGWTYLEFSKAFLKLTWPLLLGNTLEWYEFGIYSYVEKEIAANFFGGSSMGAWLGYAVTFVARPLGGACEDYVSPDPAIWRNNTCNQPGKTTVAPN